jgi:hypothetical protein
VWSLYQGYDKDNTVTVQKDLVAHGGFAARAHVVKGGGGFAMLKETKTFPALAESFWGRAYVYINMGTSVGHTGFFDAYDATDHRVLEIGQNDATWAIVEYSGAGEQPEGNSSMIPLKKWVCFEWHFDRSTSPLMTAYIDGQVAAQYQETHPIDAFASHGLGIDNHGPIPEDDDVYLDDIAIDANRIGCLP